MSEALRQGSGDLGNWGDAADGSFHESDLARGHHEKRVIDPHKSEAKTTTADDSEGISRRDFIKRVGTGAALLMALGAGGYLAGKGEKIKEAEEDKVIERIKNNSDIQVALLDDGDTLWKYFNRSGWNDESIDSYYYLQALVEINPDTNLTKLKAGEELKYLVKRQSQ